MPFDGANYDVTVSNPVTELLEQAWRLIDKPQKWCRGHLESLDGHRLCSVGALQVAACVRDAHIEHIFALVALARAMDTSVPAIVWFNDEHSHREVAAAWQRAIALSRTLVSL